MKEKNLREKKLESLLSNQIRTLYEKELKHQLKEINYQFFNDKLIIIMEESVTQPELILTENSKKELAQKVRNFFDQILQPQIKNSVEEVLNVKVVDFLSDTTLETSRTGAIAIFELQQATSASEITGASQL